MWLIFQSETHVSITINIYSFFPSFSAKAPSVRHPSKGNCDACKKIHLNFSAQFRRRFKALKRQTAPPFQSKFSRRFTFQRKSQHKSFKQSNYPLNSQGGPKGFEIERRTEQFQLTYISSPKIFLFKLHLAKIDISDVPASFCAQ